MAFFSRSYISTTHTLLRQHLSISARKHRMHFNEPRERMKVATKVSYFFCKIASRTIKAEIVQFLIRVELLPLLQLVAQSFRG